MGNLPLTTKNTAGALYGSEAPAFTGDNKMTDKKTKEFAKRKKLLQELEAPTLKGLRDLGVVEVDVAPEEEYVPEEDRLDPMEQHDDDIQEQHDEESLENAVVTSDGVEELFGQITEESILDDMASSLPEFWEKDEKTGRYPLDTKVLAILFMEGTQKQVDDIMIPAYTTVGRMMGLDPKTLSNWWKNRKDIVAQSDTMTQRLEKYTLLQLSIIVHKLTNQMMNLKLDDVKPKDLTNMFSTVFNKLRLLQNRSTSNVAQKHVVDSVLPGGEE
jgi:hypothetical protein